MDCCTRLRCILAFKIVLNKPNFSRSSLKFPSAILDKAIPLDGWFVLSFEFGTTVLDSAFETAAVHNSFEFGTAVARRLEQASEKKYTKSLKLQE